VSLFFLPFGRPFRFARLTRLEAMFFRVSAAFDEHLFVNALYRDAIFRRLAGRPW
jgi:hypothetical protein